MSPTDRVLGVAAHPDDIDIACGGSIRHWTNSGTDVFYCLATTGENGKRAGSGQSSNYRVEEQQRAAEILGVRGVEFLDERDGEIENTPPLRIKLASAIRSIKPTVVLTHSPRLNLSSIRFSHPDHIATGTATLAAIFPYARSVELLDDGREPWVVTRALFFGDEEPNSFVDVSAELDAKVAAVSEHRSQLGGFPDDLCSFFVEWAEELAVQLNAGARRIEAFREMDTR